MKQGDSARRRRLISALSAAALAAVGTAGSGATTHTWNVAGNGNWSTAGNWTPSGVPVAGDTAALVNTDGVARTITYDYTGAAVTLGALEVSLNGSSSAYETLSIGANNLSSAGEYIGGYGGSAIGGAGQVVQSGGNNIDTSTAYLGYNAGDKGVYNLSAGLFNVSGTLYAGYSGAGTVNQTGGQLNVSSGYYIGDAGTGIANQSGGSTTVGYLVAGYTTTGTYCLSGGSLTVTAITYLGYSGNGFFNQSNGYASFGSLYLGYIAGSSGSYNITGGSVTANTLFVGYSGLGTVNQTGGTVTTTNSLEVGESNNGNMYNLTGQGTLTVGTTLDVGLYYKGTLNLSGNQAVASVAGYTTVGAGLLGTGQGTINISAGAVLNTPYLYVGGNNTTAGGPGVVNVNAGGLLNLGSGTLTVYNTSGTSLNLNGGTITANSLNLYNPARFNWTSGTLNVTAGNVFVDSAGSGNELGPALTINSAKALYPNYLYVGSSGAGTVNQTGGLVSLPNGELVMPGISYTAVSPGNATYNLSGGVLTAPVLFVGFFNPGQCAFTQSGGTFVASSFIMLANSDLNSTTFTLSGGTAATNEFDLVAGAVTLNQSGGHLAIGTAGAPGSLNIGAIQSAGYDVSAFNDQFNLSGGSCIVNGTMGVGGGLPQAGSPGYITTGPGGTGVVTVSGTGQLTVTGTLKVYNTYGTSLNLQTGGSISAGTLDTGNNPSLLNWTGGTLAITGSTFYIDSLAAIAPLGSAVVLNSGMALNVSQGEQIGVTGAGSLTINSGAVHNVGGTLTVGGGGSLNVASGGLLSAAGFNLAGGTVSGTITNTGTFTYSSGTFAGRLINQGYVALPSPGSFSPGGGIENDNYLAVTTGQAIYSAGTIDNFGELDLEGGTLGAQSPGIGQVINDYGGTAYLSGTIANASLVNNGVLYVNGQLTLGGIQSSNYGQMTIGSEANLRTPVSSIGLDNYGTLTISGGTISAALGNDTGGTLIASGTGNSITGTFQNNGTMQIQGSSSLLVKSGFGNGSLILLQGTGASLTGGTLSNAGTIQGVGQVGCVVTNTGIIMGTGSIITGGLTNSAGAQVNLTGGANVFGPVTNAGAMHLYGSPITFYGNVTSTGTVKVTAGAAYFLGSNGASIGGTYNSDPSDNYFQGLTITPTGLVTGGTGDRFFIVGGATLNNAGTFNDPGTLSAVSVANSGTFIQTGTLVETGPFSNSGVATIGGTQNWSAGTTFTNTGTATFQTDSGSATASPLAVAANAGTVTFTSTQHLASLALAPGARAVVTSGVHRSVIVATSFTDAGTVDLSTGDLDLPGASLQAITALAASGYDLTAGGNWSGPGITSTSAATDTTRLTAIGVIRNNQSGTAIYAAANPFDGVTPGTGDVLVKYTYYGDANLDGKVDGSDYSLTDAGYASHGALTGWFNGDFNYDGTIDGSDYALIDNAFNNQGSAVTSAALVATATAQVAVTTAAVPEPACVSVLTFTLAAFTRRRR